jgi:hypothetical protein
MSTITGPNTNESGLVFAFDIGDRGSSFIGKPTVNYISNPTEEMARGEFGQYRDLAPTFNTYGLVPYSLSMDIKTNIPGGVYVYMQNGSTSRHGFVGSSVSATPTWKRFYFQNLTPSLNDPGTAASTLATYTGYGSGINPTVRNIQLELGAYSTPFVDGTRTSTQSLIDLTGNNSINTSGVSFDSTGNITFDATDDFLTLGSDVTFKTTGGWTVESVVYYNSVAGGYNNTTSPANFIGAEGIDYNSWYWSVLDNRLALWNVSPGYWRYGSTTLQPNRFYHVTIVSSANGYYYRFYLNGVAEGGDHVSQVWNPDYSGLKVRYIGKGNNGNPRLVNGKIPVTKIYNRPLLDSEIYNNFLGYKTRFNL